MLAAVAVVVVDIQRAGPVFHPSWTAGARARVEMAIERHGGWGLWKRLDSVSLSLVNLAGVLPWLKGYHRTFELPHRLTSSPKRGLGEFRDRRAGNVVVAFQRGDVRVYDPTSGQLLRDLRAHRRSFHGFRKLRRWSIADACYFFGYAFDTYTALPFVLPGLRFIDETRARWRGTDLFGVTIEFPAGADVHSRRQSFHFDAQGLLRRNDYVADVVGWWARAAHGWDDFVEVEGLPVPTRRSVVYRLRRAVLPRPLILTATFADVAVSLD
jgi:hypothetical protein